MTSEFRQDLVSGNWVLISTSRSKRPLKKQKDKLYQTKEECPFENLQTSGHSDPIAAYLNGKRISWEGPFSSEWTTQIIRNKFPALQSGACGAMRKTGPFCVYDANGFHELVVTKDHDKSFAQFTNDETAEVILAYRNRFREISQDECGDYVSIFHNHGKLAGASVYHSHSQIISTPILPPEIVESIRGSGRFFAEHSKKVHEILMEWEIGEQKRIVYENDKFIAFCPFVSKTPYEIRIFPKIAHPYFSGLSDADIPLLADVLSVVLRKVHVALDNVDYNFYIHTAPVQHDPLLNYEFYQWHIEVVPRITAIAGFELGTAIFINPIDPDDAARHLRETTV